MGKGYIEGLRVGNMRVARSDLHLQMGRVIIV